jgi:hypothetical protein
VTFRNNMIMHNQCLGEGTFVWGGGGGFGFMYNNPIEFYNNIVAYNYSGKQSGGLYLYYSNINIVNNTIYGNRAALNGQNLRIESSSCRIFNNIIWSDTISEEVENIALVGFRPQAMYNNLISEPFGPEEPFIGQGNVFLEPGFTNESFEPSENSPVIGRGADSLLIGGKWYSAPDYDLYGNERPGDADSFIDIGAIETNFQQPLLANADLASLWADGHHLIPSFQKDTLNYLMVRESGAIMTDNWYIYPADNLATLEVDSAQDLTSENEQDRTTNILVTASDGTTQKQYTVIYKYYSSDATLASLEVSKGVLEPEFDPVVLTYFDTIPYGSRITPEVLCAASDTGASVIIKPAKYPYVASEALRTTYIYVTAPNDTMQEYTILFTVDNTRPEITLIHDSVEIGGEIGAVISESDQVYLVPANTPGIFDSITASALTWLEAGANDTVYLSTEGLDTINYWVYACNRHQSVSENQVVTIFEAEETTAVSEIHYEGIRVYPTPVNHTLYFDSPFPLEQVDLYNVLGIPVLKVYKPDSEIPVSNLPEGVYILRAITEQNQVYTVRIIKQ